MSLDRKVIGYKIRTVSELIYEDELVKNMTIEICYKATNTNSNSIYIPIKVYLEGYNKYKLRAYIDCGCSVCDHCCKRMGSHSIDIKIVLRDQSNLSSFVYQNMISKF